MKNWKRTQSLCYLLVNPSEWPKLASGSQSYTYEDLYKLSKKEECEAEFAFTLSEADYSEKRLPQVVSAEFRRLSAVNVRRNMAITAQALTIARLLNKEEIVPIFLKGTAYLLDRLDHGTGSRRQVDIDLVVKPEAIGPACQAFFKAGYSFFSEKEGRLHQDLRLAHDESRNHHHLPPLYKEDRLATVEIHYSHLPKIFEKMELTGQLIRSARLFSHQDIQFMTPSIEHQIIHIVLGNYLHDRYYHSCRPPIRPGLDFIEILEFSGKAPPAIDFEYIGDKCGKYLESFEKDVEMLFSYRREPSLTGLQSRSLRRAIMQKSTGSKLSEVVLGYFGDLLYHAYTAYKRPLFFLRKLTNKIF